MRLLAGGIEGPSESGDALGFSAAGQGGDGAAGEAGRMAGAGVSECGDEPAGRAGGDVHGEPFGLVAEPGSVLGDDERYRKPAQWGATADTQDLPVARWQDG